MVLILSIYKDSMSFLLDIDRKTKKHSIESCLCCDSILLVLEIKLLQLNHVGLTDRNCFWYMV